MKFFYVLAIWVGLIGNANSQPSQQAFQQEAENVLQTAVLRMQNDVEVKKLSKKMWLGDIRQTPLNFYAIEEKVSAEEKIPLEQFNKLRAINFSEAEFLVKKYKLPISDLTNMLFAANSSLIVDLYIGKITYGQHAIKKKELHDFYHAAVVERVRQASVTEQVQRDAAFVDLQNYLLNQNLINTLNQPSRISPFSCTKLGATVSCW